MKSHPTRLAALAAALITAAFFFAVVAAQASTPLKFSFSGDAYGTSVTGSTIKSSPTFPASLGSGCSVAAGDTAHNSGLAANVSAVLTTGTIDNTVTTSAGTNGGSSTAKSSVQTVSLLSGLISAGAVNAVSKVSYTTGSGFSFNNNSSVASLTVNGTVVSAPAPNTRVDIPGLGYVIVNEQTRTVKPNFATQTVNMLHLYVNVSGNTFGLVSGTQIIVGHASAGISVPLGAGGPVSGGAYGSSANVGTTVIVGKTAEVSIPCLGGSKTRQVLSTTMPGIGSTGTVYTTAKATLSPAATSAEATATVSTVKLLGGLVKAAEVKADAHGTYDGVTHKLSDSGSGFTNLQVNGQDLTNVGVNAKVTLQNIGTLYLHRVIKGTKSITVRMIELVVTVSNNPLNLKLGTDIRIAVANVAFRD